MKLVVGLGNPGKEYVGTRHNAGFMVVDNYLGEVEYKKKFNAFVVETIVENQKVVFVKPQTFMNLSGNAVREIMNFYKIEIDELLIIHDELDLEIGNWKLSRDKSSAGHNGVQNIFDNLNTNDIARLRIGISNDYKTNGMDFVLDKFSKDDLELLSRNYPIFKEIIKAFIKNGYHGAMKELSEQKHREKIS